jgi:hypothetical protein
MEFWARTKKKGEKGEEGPNQKAQDFSLEEEKKRSKGLKRG